MRTSWNISSVLFQVLDMFIFSWLRLVPWMQIRWDYIWMQVRHLVNLSHNTLINSFTSRSHTLFVELPSMVSECQLLIVYTIAERVVWMLLCSWSIFDQAFWNTSENVNQTMLSKKLCSNWSCVSSIFPVNHRNKALIWCQIGNRVWFVPNLFLKMLHD